MRIQFNQVARSYTDYTEMATKALGRRPINQECREEFEVRKDLRTAARFCGNCGAELYGKWMYTNYIRRASLSMHPYKYYETGIWAEKYRAYEAAYDRLGEISREADNEKNAAKQEAARFASLKTCPCCGGELRNEPGYFAQIYYVNHNFYLDKTCIVDSYERDNLGDVFGNLKKLREPQEKQTAEDTASQLAKRLDVPVSGTISAEQMGTIKGTSAALQNYLQQIVRLESSIYALTKRLGSLYYQRVLTSRDAVAAKLEPAERIRKETEKARLSIQPLTEALHAEQAKPLPQLRIGYPKKPAAPSEPRRPLLETPGFFNKKKVLLENEAKMARYSGEMEEYRRKLAEYETAVAAWERQTFACQKEEDRQREENRKRRDAAIEQAQKALDAAQRKYDELKATEEARIAEAAAMPVPADAAVEMLEKEISEAERLLKELFAARNTLYAYNVVFPKYRNIVALSTFCEYLMTGRCEALEGANGAYNLYESECRADMIISQLSVVIESLEQVKQNQYMIYSELQNIRSDLADLNSTMNAALKSIQNIDVTTAKMSEQMDKIAENTDVIAHNTAVTAYYSKVNAELTNALGYMVAFK